MQHSAHILLNTHSLLKVALLGAAGFALAMLLTPLYTKLAYKFEWWEAAAYAYLTGQPATVFNSLHAEKHKRHIPTMAGVIFIGATIILTLIFNLSRTETWLPLAAFAGAAIVGLIDDIFNIKSNGQGVAGLPSKVKLALITLVALVGGWYFFSKLGVDSINWPGLAGGLHLGWVIIPVFVVVVVAMGNAVNISDGLDGLAGGLTATAFTIYAIIAALEHRYGVSGFCLTVVGALLSYTWFNVFPARFFMGDVGSFALGTALGVVAMITNTVLLLPIIGLVFIAEAGSVILQITSKKLRNGKKIFRVSPVHHHFEAIGWPETKVTMRFWVIGQVAGMLGLVLFLYGRYV